ncbi:Zinc finger CCCH-type [Penicillium sp. DV-2018c]|nr:Zinc finger CCCH-type [Penicillium sp. DV-2018c]KAJ5567573.1 Zinc finger CCCH-type [Penicillium sp. DV-2018c]
MATPGRPQFFCSRPDGTLTPLIALDELPTGISVCGVSRTLTAGETQGMTSCGLAAQRPENWVIDGVPQPSPNEQATETQQLMLQVMTNAKVPEEIRNSARKILCNEVDRLGAPTGDGHASSNGMSSEAPAFQVGMNSGNRNAPKKEYCSYWLRHGECDYAQQGCLYKHHVPTDLATLHWLGLRDIPRWYREKYNIPSLLSRGNVRQQLAIGSGSTPQAVPPSVPGTNEETGNNKGPNVTTNGNGRFLSPPPRGPANRGMLNAHNYGQYRGVYRNGATGNWKNSPRNGRHPVASPTPNSTSSERSGDQYPRTSQPPASFSEGSNSAVFGTSYSDNDSNTAMTPFTAATFATAPVAPVALGARQGATNVSLLDDGISRNCPWDWRVNNLNDGAQDPFGHVPTKPVERSWRPPRADQMHEHSSKTSFDGGVPTTTRSNMNASRSSDLSFFGNLSLEDNDGLTQNDTRVTWGPIGGPILKHTPPLADENSSLSVATPSSRHTD